MILAIDIGNTNIVIGCISNEKTLFVERLSTDATKTELEYAISFKNVLELYHINPEELNGSIISSVVPPITNIIRDSVIKITGKKVMIIGPGVKTGLNILMDNPAQLGSDLVANAVAGIHEYPVPLIIIDMGTATTISIVDKNKNYIGGMIMPGIRVSSDTLTQRTSQLPKISLEPPKKLIGTNTIDCMKSGIVHGNAACIDGMVSRIQKDLGQKATVVATGGLAKTIVPLCEAEIILDDALLLKGLNYIYEKNRA
ncbi:type III pantothenate kinase [Murimonas intestini]|uniref:Type III pantothenate kinase n=1 Tax=Murimonas intestini TaxID=1337051 RepID=A0AB73T1N2_9FIRM|nr:type III pantothenate kinase [Murimonas intestini]MCR1842400.1 type III pantothenate kinase [Murimonas intestini]MCR1867242.1 type III pantothenate kinase [Murimonas intestini]MCR1884428.1 type III pantothenate kinase [Murimonas intestini]